MRHFSLLLLILLLSCCRTVPKGVKPIAPFDIKRYAGTWYEIGRKEQKSAKGLANVSATFIVEEDGKVKVISKSYNVFNGKWRQASGKAKLVNEGKEGRLKLSFFGPFYSPYNIIAIDPEYENALVTGKERTELWFLSKSPKMRDEVKAHYMSIAENAGFNVDNIIWITHNANAQ